MRKSKVRAEQRTKQNLYTIAQAASLIGVSRQTLWRLAKRGVSRPIVQHVGKRRMPLFSEAEIRRIVEHYAKQGGPRILARRPVAATALNPKGGVPEAAKPALDLLAQMLADAVVADMQRNKDSG